MDDDVMMLASIRLRNNNSIQKRWDTVPLIQNNRDERLI